MEQSSTYQAIVRRGREEGRAEGRAEEARRILLLQGELKFGAPDESTRRALDTISDLSALEHLTARIVSAGCWEELLPPQPKRKNGRRKSRD